MNNACIYWYRNKEMGVGIWFLIWSDQDLGGHTEGVHLSKWQGYEI